MDSVYFTDASVCEGDEGIWCAVDKCPGQTACKPDGSPCANGEFCNFDDGSSGFCEQCSSFSDSTDCENEGFINPSAGSADCKACCFGGEYTGPLTTPTAGRRRLTTPEGCALYVGGPVVASQNNQVATRAIQRGDMASMADSERFSSPPMFFVVVLRTRGADGESELRVRSRCAADARCETGGVRCEVRAVAQGLGRGHHRATK